MKTILGLLLLGMTFAFGDGPEAKYPPLALHPDNSRYLLFRGKPIVLVGSSEHYGSVLNLDFDYIRYLDTIKAEGLNCTRLFTGSYHEAPGDFGIMDNPLAPAAARYIAPWKRVEGGKFDLTQFSPDYFARLKDFLAQAAKRNIVVEVNLFSPNYADTQWRGCPMNAINNINGVGAFPRTELYNLKHPDMLKVQDELVRKVVSECQGFDNLYFEACNEPYETGIGMDWQSHIVDVIHDTETNLPARHLISLNIGRGKAIIDHPNPAVSIFNFHYQSPDVVAHNSGVKGMLGENETGFEGGGDDAYRIEGWDFILSGGGSYISLDYSFTVGTPDGTKVGYKAPGGGSVTLRRQLRALHEFITSFDFVRMKPDPSIIKSVLPHGVVARALVEPGKQYALYIHGGQVSELNLQLTAGKYDLRWVDPKSGQDLGKAQVESTGGIETLHPPQYGSDIALSLVAR